MIKICKYCKKEFNANKKDRKFCSKKCSGLAKRGEKKELICPICGKKFYRKEYELKKLKMTPCCSKECQNKNRQKYPNLNYDVEFRNIQNVWNGIIKRCYSSTNKSYKDYGGRGIKVCDEWKDDFMSFYNWAYSNGYKKGLTIERINVNGNYEPANCTWITMEEQAKNKRNCLYVNYKGNQIRLAEIANIFQFDYKDLWQTYQKNNKDIEKSIEICTLHKKGLMVTNKSGVVGVSYNKRYKKWDVTYKNKWYGRYSSKEEAINVRTKITKNGNVNKDK